MSSIPCRLRHLLSKINLRTFLFHLSHTEPSSQAVMASRRDDLCSNSPGESFEQPEVPEKGDVVQRIPERTLSVPLGQADVPPVALFCHADDGVGGEDVVLTACVVGIDHPQVVRSEEQPCVSLVVEEP